MIPIFQLTPEEQKELDEKIKALGEFSFDRVGEFMGVALIFHEDIHIKRLTDPDWNITDRIREAKEKREKGEGPWNSANKDY